MQTELIFTISLQWARPIRSRRDLNTSLQFSRIQSSQYVHEYTHTCPCLSTIISCSVPWVWLSHQWKLKDCVIINPSDSENASSGWAHTCITCRVYHAAPSSPHFKTRATPKYGKTLKPYILQSILPAYEACDCNLTDTTQTPLVTTSSSLQKSKKLRK